MSFLASPDSRPVVLTLDAFEPDDALLGELKAQYRKGGLGDSVLKRRLNDRLQALVGPIRERREQFAADRGEVARMLRKGTAQARERVAATVAEVKGASGLTYF